MTMLSTQSIVRQNSKCEGCAHYDGNAAMQGGVCDVGTQPYACGTGTDPKLAYAPLAEMSTTEVDDLATPCVNGSPGSMNEQGNIEQRITMKVVCLGDELASAAETIHGMMTDIHKGGIAPEQGQTSRFSPAGHMPPHLLGEVPTLAHVAKSVWVNHMSPRQQHKFSLKEVLDFLSNKGFEVTDSDYTAVQE